MHSQVDLGVANSRRSLAAQVSLQLPFLSSMVASRIRLGLEWRLPQLLAADAFEPIRLRGGSDAVFFRRFHADRGLSILRSGLPFRLPLPPSLPAFPSARLLHAPMS